MTENIQFGNLKISITTEPKKTVLIFSGNVDEHFKQEDVPRVESETIIFDLSEVENFNSCGIREWIYLIKDYSNLGKLIFRNCSVTMIDQVNMVPDSIGNAKIESFYAPYYCESESCCGETNRLIQISEHIETLKEKKAPEFNCESCGKPLEFDALEESYFLFLDNMNAFPQAS
ncbi:MAG: hypothetical protein R3B45_07510 [Bdellovibrionota bacterium]